MQWLVENGIPAYNAPDLAVRAMGVLREYAQLQALKREPINNNYAVDEKKARKLSRKYVNRTAPG